MTVHKLEQHISRQKAAHISIELNVIFQVLFFVMKVSDSDVCVSADGCPVLMICWDVAVFFASVVVDLVDCWTVIVDRYGDGETLAFEVYTCCVVEVVDSTAMKPVLIVLCVAELSGWQVVETIGSLVIVLVNW